MTFDTRQPRSLARRDFLRMALAASAGGAAAYAIACSSSTTSPLNTPVPTATSRAETTPGPTPAGSIKPAMLTSEFAVNQPNRFAIGLLDAQSHLVKNAAVHLRFFQVAQGNTGTGTLRAEGDAHYMELDVPGAHLHDKSTGVAAEDDSVAFYVAAVPFDQVGQWGVEIQVKPEDGSAPVTIQAPFNVLQDWVTPGPGAEPPKSQNDTTATNSNPASLCSRDPACPLHDKVIADMLGSGSGRPLVVQFSTPAFCQTRFCGPVLEVLLNQVPAYQDRVDFVHIEVWQDFQLQKHRPAVDEWHLPGEPYTFFIDKSGVVVGRFEAIFSDEELTTALDQLVKL